MGIYVRGSVSVKIEHEKIKLRPLLTSDEWSNLRIIASRRTFKGIADELNISIRSAEYLVEKLREKCRCHTKRELIMLAFCLGVVEEVVIPQIF